MTDVDRIVDQRPDGCAAPEAFVPFGFDSLIIEVLGQAFRCSSVRATAFPSMVT